MFGDEPAFPSKSSQIEDHSLQLNLYRNSGKNLESNHPCLPPSTLRLMDKQNKSIKSWNNTYASSVTSNRIIPFHDMVWLPSPFHSTTTVCYKQPHCRRTSSTTQSSPI